MAFKPGVSGNPAGRPRGSRNNSTRLREKLDRELPSILKKLTALALDGDVAAAKLILDRALPPLRAEAATVRLTGVQGDGLSAQAGAVLTAVTEGRLAPDTGAMLLSALANTVRVVEVADISRRLEALEAEKNGAE